MKGLERKPFIFIPLSNNELRQLVLGMYGFKGIFLRIRARVKKDYSSPRVPGNHIAQPLFTDGKKNIEHFCSMNRTFLFNEMNILNKHDCTS